MNQPIIHIWKKQLSLVIMHSANCLKTDDDQTCHSKGGENHVSTCAVWIKCILCGITLNWATMTTELQFVSSAKKNVTYSLLAVDASHTCLWKFRSLSALSSMLALVLKSPAREPGRFSSSWIRWAIRACNLVNKKKVKKVVFQDLKSVFFLKLQYLLFLFLISPVLSLLEDLHWVQTPGFLYGCDAVLFLMKYHGRLGRLSWRLGLRGHDGRGSGRNRRWCWRRAARGLRRY